MDVPNIFDKQTMKKDERRVLEAVALRAAAEGSTPLSLGTPPISPKSALSKQERKAMEREVLSRTIASTHAVPFRRIRKTTSPPSTPRLAAEDERVNSGEERRATTGGEKAASTEGDWSSVGSYVAGVVSRYMPTPGAATRPTGGEEDTEIDAPHWYQLLRPSGQRSTSPQGNLSPPPWYSLGGLTAGVGPTSPASRSSLMRHEDAASLLLLSHIGNG